MKLLFQKSREIEIARATGKLSTGLAYQYLKDEVASLEEKNKVKPKNTINTYYAGVNPND